MIDDARAAFAQLGPRPRVASRRSRPSSDHAEARRAEELDRLFRRMPLGDHERELVEQMSHRLVAGLLHQPLVVLREDGTGEAERAARDALRALADDAMTRTLRIGTRGSALALVQARWTAARLAEHGVATEITIIRTEGDDRPVDTAWGEGAFVGRIVAALLDGDRRPRRPLRQGRPHRRAPAARDRRLPAPRGPARRARLPRAGHDPRDAADRRPRGHRQPAPGRVPPGACAPTSRCTRSTATWTRGSPSWTAATPTRWSSRSPG